MKLYRITLGIVGITLSVGLMAKTPCGFAQSTLPQPTPPPSSPTPTNQVPPGKSSVATPAPQNTQKAAPSYPVRPEGIAAKVNGQAIQLVSLDRRLLGVPPEKRGEARMDVLRLLIDQSLVDQAVLGWKITVSAEDVNKQFAELVKKWKEVEKQDFSEFLKKTMFTEQELREEIAALLRWDRFVDQQGKEETLKTFYLQNKDMFDGSMVRARHILIRCNASDKDTKLQKARSLKQEMETKVNKELQDQLAKMTVKVDNLAKEQLRTKLVEQVFSDTARQYSDCPSKQEGGDLNWFPRLSSMVEPFAKAAFLLKPFSISEPIETEFGYHLILVTARRPGKEYKYEEIKSHVKDAYGMKLHERVVELMRKNAKIEVMPEIKR